MDNYDPAASIDTKAPWRNALRRVANQWRRPPKMSGSEWADRYRVLPRESSAEPGRFYTSRAEYQRGMVDACTSGLYETVVFKTSIQVGKTETLANIIGYHIHLDPCPMLMVWPSMDNGGKGFSRERLAPMLRDTPALRAIVGDPRARQANQTLISKAFPGGHIAITGSNSPAGLASRPVRIVLMDEVDKYPDSAGSEGDPVKLAMKRTDTYWNRLHLLASTPGMEGESRIDAEYKLSDQRKYYVPCHSCGHFQTLMWEYVRFDKADPLNTAHYVCEHCEERWSEAQKNLSVKEGEWRATATAQGSRAGFYINALYSPWSTMGRVAQEHQEAYNANDFELMKVWHTGCMGEAWEYEGEGVDEGELLGRLEDYDETNLPDAILMMTCGVDVQKDRVEASVFGWGHKKERWLVEHKVIWGNTDEEAVWAELDEFLKTQYSVAGLRMNIVCTLVDSGYRADMVYNFTRPRQGRWIFASKGHSGIKDMPLVKNKSQVGKGRAKRTTLWHIGVDRGKDSIILSSLQLREPGANYIHLPRTVDSEYCDQLTAEERRTKKKMGRNTHYWHPKRERNEALDCGILALAALDIRRPDMDKIESNRAKAVSTNRSSATKPRAVGPARDFALEQRNARKRTGRRSFLKG